MTHKARLFSRMYYERPIRASAPYLRQRIALRTFGLPLEALGQQGD
jgi:hypothetical protein